MVKRHYAAIVIGVGGVILIAMGILILTGELHRAQQLGPEAHQRPGTQPLGLAEPRELNVPECSL